MDEHNELCTRLRAVGMELFRRDGLRFTMQQAAAMMHISKKTIYAVYPSKEALLLDMVDDAFTRIHARKQRILDGPGTLAEKLRAVIIALPEEYTALDLQQMDLLDEKYPRVAARVREHLETGWEPTLALLEQAMWRLLRAETSCHYYWGEAWVPRALNDMRASEAALEKIVARLGE